MRAFLGKMVVDTATGFRGMCTGVMEGLGEQPSVRIERQSDSGTSQIWPPVDRVQLTDDPKPAEDMGVATDPGE